MTLFSIQNVRLVAFSFFLFSAALLTAQIHKVEHHSCGTVPMTADEIRYTLDVVAKKVVLRNAGMTCVPLQAHVVRKSDGTGGITNETLNKGLANANHYFLAAGIEFFWANLPDYYNSDDYYDFNKNAPDLDTETELIGLFGRANNAINVYFVNRVNGGTSTGYANYPSPNANTNTIVMDRNSHASAIGSVFVHEMGHFFDLVHTFEGTEKGNTNARAENVARVGANANCLTKGDYLCDTDADPNHNSAQFIEATCTYTGVGTDIHGMPYTPPTNNIMSYYPSRCSNHQFTPNQITRIQQALVTRQGYVNYSMNAQPMVVANPNLLAATQSAAALSVVLTWADNANNEMGYLIERSTVSNSSGFKPLPLGATGDDMTTFTDINVSPNTTYYYRIKASNDNCNDYSNVISFTTQNAYCVPNYITNCASAGATPQTIGQFILKTNKNATLINNNNKNCLGAISDFTSNPALSANVTSGTVYNFEVYLGEVPVTRWYYAQDIGIWLDINNDKDFNDVGECLGIFQYTNFGANNKVSGSIAIPATTSIGAKRLRIRSTTRDAGMTNTDACSSSSYGEAEDYTLHVTGAALPIVLNRFQGESTEGSNQLTWHTESEVSAAYFEVERSINGQKFDKIATTKAFGKANTYVLNDSKTAQNTHYYRLKIVDNDGSFSYSQIITLRNVDNQKDALHVFPNPVSQILIIETMEEGDRQVVNLLGQTVLRSKATQQIDVSALPTGTYFLKIGNQQARFVKQ